MKSTTVEKAIAELETKNVSVYEVCEKLTAPTTWNMENIFDIVINYADYTDLTFELDGYALADYAFTLLYVELTKYCFENKLDVTFK